MSEAVQRWRLVYTRGEEARFLSHLDAAKAWERAFRRASIPVATTEGLHARPRVIFAAPLPLGMLAEHELVDLYLSERSTRPSLRSQLVQNLPRGYGLVDLHDVWLGAPALAVQLVAADYRMVVIGAEAAKLRRAATALLGADTLQRERRRENKTIAYDLRPLLIDLDVRESALPGGRPAAEVRTRLRHTQDQGSGRAEEVVAALSDELGFDTDGSPAGSFGDSGPRGEPIGSLEIVRPVRERLWLAEEMPEPVGFAGDVPPR